MKSMKSIRYIPLIFVSIVCIIIWFTYTSGNKSKDEVYTGILKNSVLNNKLAGKWEINCYLKPYNSEVLPLCGDVRSKEDTQAHMCYFELEYLGADKQFLGEIDSIDLRIDWNRGDIRSYTGSYAIESGSLVEDNDNSKIKYFYLPNSYFSPEYIRKLETQMVITLHDGSKLDYYGALKY